MKTLEVLLKGQLHYSLPDVIDQLQDGTSVVLKVEPDNKWQANAVMVQFIHDGNTYDLGHLSAQAAPGVARLVGIYAYTADIQIKHRGKFPIVIVRIHFEQ